MSNKSEELKEALAAAAQGAEQQPANQNDGSNKIVLGDIKGDNAAEIADKCLQQFPETTLYKAKVTCVNNILEKEEYTLVTLTLDKNLRRMEASKEDEDLFVEGKTKRITVMLSNVLALLKSREDTVKFYNLAKQQPDYLYEWLPGMKISILEMDVEERQEWVNPFSESRTIKMYDEKRILHFPVEIVEMPETNMKSMKLASLLKKSVLGADTILALL